MKYTAGNRTRLIIALSILCLIIILAGFSEAVAAEASATFTVEWYDVGQDALEGLDGVNKVTKGFRDSKEINTVYYDSEKISIQDMETALKEAGTYTGTLEE